jgi:PKD repeat protein
VTSVGIVDVGRLSSKTATTGGDGRATVTYTAPTLPSSGNSDPGYGVTIQAIPSGTDYSAAVPRTVDIRLVPQGIILPVAHAPVPRFTWSPTAPGEGADITFDGSSSIASCSPDPTAPNDATKCTPEGGNIVLYQWDFGNGRTGNGVQPHTSFDAAGTYVVKLTVANDRGLTNSATNTVSVTAVAKPTASFTYSPANPNINEGIHFDASASTASTGRSIVSYSWNWGDGNFGSGVQTSHVFTKAQSYTITLTVTDNAGSTGTSSQTLTFNAGKKPTARFTFSPTAPKPGQTVNFDGTLSTPFDPNRPIVKYDWNFGDGTTLLDSTEPRPAHSFAAGAYNVTLKVTDSAGGVSDVFTSTVSVNP